MTPISGEGHSFLAISEMKSYTFSIASRWYQYRKLMKMWGESMIAGMEKKHVIDLTPKE